MHTIQKVIVSNVREYKNKKGHVTARGEIITPAGTMDFSAPIELLPELKVFGKMIEVDMNIRSFRNINTGKNEINIQITKIIK